MPPFLQKNEYFVRQKQTPSTKKRFHFTLGSSLLEKWIGFSLFLPKIIPNSEILQCEERKTLKMQEKVKNEGREGTRSVGVDLPFVKRAIGVAARESVWVGCAYLLGHIQMIFGTYPIALSLLCASGKHTVAILVGAVLAALSVGVTPEVYIGALTAAAIVRILSVAVLEGVGEKRTLSERVRKKMNADSNSEEVYAGEDAKGERTGKRRSVAAVLEVLFSERVRLRMITEP